MKIQNIFGEVSIEDIINDYFKLECPDINFDNVIVQNIIYLRK